LKRTGRLPIPLPALLLWFYLRTISLVFANLILGFFMFPPELPPEQI
jgi:hypothetical protein